MANTQNLKPWRPGQSGNVKGRPMGSKNLATRIRELMNDENFEANILDAKAGIREYKGLAIDAIIIVAITRAINGDAKARDWLSKFGWGNKIQIEYEVEANEVIYDPQLAEEFKVWMLERTKQH